MQIAINKNQFIIMVLFGISALVGGFLEYRIMHIDNGWQRTDGFVLSVDRSIELSVSSNHMVLQYTVEGKSYRFRASDSSSIIPEIGAKKAIAYNPADPDQAKLVVGFRPLAILLPIVGIWIIWFARRLYTKPKE